MRRWKRSAAFAGAAGMALLLSMPASFAFGPEAHRVIALVADHRLEQTDPKAPAKIKALLAADKTDRLTRTDIADEATWADVLIQKSQEARTATTAWHATRLKADNPDLGAACFGHKPLPSGYPASHGPQDNCSVDKVQQFAAELANPQTSQFERLAALKFLLNIVGDLNDPLLAIDHGDRGGQCTAVQVGGRPPVRLASYWEEVLVREVVGGNAAGGAARIAAAIPAAEAQQWAAGTPETWARDSYEVAKNVLYGFGPEKPAGTANFPARKGETSVCASAPLYKVGPEYETKALAAMKAQLAKGGVRLAAVLRNGFK